MNDLGRYFIRILANNRVFIRSNTTGRSDNLGSVNEIPDFIRADILNEVYVPSAKTDFSIDFGREDD